MSVLKHTLNASHAGKIKRQEGNVESIPFLMQLNHECIKVWTTQNKNDRMTQINYSFGIF